MQSSVLIGKCIQLTKSAENKLWASQGGFISEANARQGFACSEPETVIVSERKEGLIKDKNTGAVSICPGIF